MLTCRRNVVIVSSFFERLGNARAKGKPETGVRFGGGRALGAPVRTGGAGPSRGSVRKAAAGRDVVGPRARPVNVGERVCSMTTPAVVPTVRRPRHRPPPDRSGVVIVLAQGPSAQSSQHLHRQRAGS